MEIRAQGAVVNYAGRTETVRHPVIWLLFLLMLLAVMTAVRAVRADELHLLVNGKAIHLDHQPNVHYNERNWGSGFQYDFDRSPSGWVPFLTASGFSDSNQNPSYYAGGGWLKRHDFTWRGATWHTDVGVVGFLMTREGFRKDRPFPGVLPAFSIGTERVAINVTYIPRVEPKMVPILFFQLKLRLTDL
jgi:Antimicrobial peptide resistance and lipid A acylation protein PagP